MAFGEGQTQGCWHLSLQEAGVLVQAWVTGQQQVWALLRPGVAPEFCFASVTREEVWGPMDVSGLLVPQGVRWGRSGPGSGVSCFPWMWMSCMCSWIEGSAPWCRESLAPDLRPPFSLSLLPLPAFPVLL